MLVFVHIPPIFSVLLTYCLKSTAYFFDPLCIVKVKRNQPARYWAQRSTCSKLIVETHIYSDIHLSDRVLSLKQWREKMHMNFISQYQKKIHLAVKFLFVETKCSSYCVPVRKQSIVMTVTLSLSVLEYISGNAGSNFTKFPVLFTCGWSLDHFLAAFGYDIVHPVFGMTTCFPVIGPM